MSNRRIGPVFDPVKFERIVRNLEIRGLVVLRDEETERRLEIRGLGASCISDMILPSILLFRRSPTRIEVIEELFHHGQHFRANFISPPDEIGLFRATREIEAQIYLLGHARKRNWSQEEILFLERNLHYWQSEYDRINQD
jgi:hypothetical protein